MKINKTTVIIVGIVICFGLITFKGLTINKHTTTEDVTCKELCKLYIQNRDMQEAKRKKEEIEDAKVCIIPNTNYYIPQKYMDSSFPKYTVKQLIDLGYVSYSYTLSSNLDKSKYNKDKIELNKELCLYSKTTNFEYVSLYKYTDIDEYIGEMHNNIFLEYILIAEESKIIFIESKYSDLGKLYYKFYMKNRPELVGCFEQLDLLSKYELKECPVYSDVVEQVEEKRTHVQMAIPNGHRSIKAESGYNVYNSRPEPTGNIEDNYSVVCSGGYYHKQGCDLAGSSSTIMNKQDALNSGYSRCGKCGG